MKYDLEKYNKDPWTFWENIVNAYFDNLDEYGEKIIRRELSEKIVRVVKRLINSKNIK